MSRWTRIKKILGGLVRYLVATVSLSISFYILFALIFSTAEEKALQRENNLYRSRYQQMKEQESLIGDVVDGLLEKDNAIYEGLFETSAPSLDALTAADVLLDGKLPPESDRLMRMASLVDENFEQIFRMLESRPDSIPPLTLPLKDMSYVQAGASVGNKHNPVYKLVMRHDGLDLIATQGTPVYAAAGGKVSMVIRSHRGKGNTVEINHGNGFTTRYCLLGEIAVSDGQKVRRGQKIGTVGISTSVSAPHLHFEVRRKGAVQDPVNYLFASLTPEEYSRMLYMTSATSQSMD